MNKISIISPCYNGEAHLKPHLDAILRQDYPALEYIFVNDGSTDKTEEIALSYKEQFEAKGWTFIYIKQENAGQAAACNQGLKIMTGVYFSCLDSDDMMGETYLQEMSQYLDEHPDVALVFPTTQLVEEGTMKVRRIARRTVPAKIQDTIFDDILLRRSGNVPIFPSYLTRTQLFIEQNPTREIYPARSGQNLQIILPIIYNRKAGYLDKVLYSYLLCKNSDTRSGYEMLRLRTHSWEDLSIKVLERVSMPDYLKAYYVAEIKNYWSEYRIFLHYKELRAKKAYWAMFKGIAKTALRRIFIWVHNGI